MTGTRRPLALVTGATAGIGAEFARALAVAGNDLVLVARDAARLEATAAALRSAHGVIVDVIAADLTSSDGIAVVQQRVADREHPVDVLVNNAGFGLRGDFEQTALDDELGLLDLLVTVPMRLSHAALGQMLPRRSGTIVNIASVAGFTPRGSYGAAKAWVLSFSRWANLHYRPVGITVTAVAPGFVRTEFHDRMAVQTTAVPRFMWLDAPTLVRLALRDVARGRAVSIPTLRYKLLVAAVSLLPDRLAALGELKPR
ncbi:short-subunit dehydrogenase [Conyzicola lurida]|uniref:Short-subunit dehydrogenase n=1 Tax=Conyzicola lurida TaxID=1172621 RepID=A0A841AM20_9MICO|nr:SDR family NAD(P)-dependent oxidoreductase [Conyzicola lurida]MBB5842766.1 short-subunit dehydrogenase [Conyzicola lurida]